MSCFQLGLMCVWIRKHTVGESSSMDVAAFPLLYYAGMDVSG